MKKKVKNSMPEFQDAMKKIIQERYYIKFCKESNSIEGEEWEDLPIEAIEYAMDIVKKDTISPEDIKIIHRLHSKGLRQKVDWLGEWRKVDVHVGAWNAPEFWEVEDLMYNYCMKWSEYDSWTAHNEFEKIHPFRDLNGRVGRLLWLIKAVEEGYKFSIPFLQAYYYQTLARYH